MRIMTLGCHNASHEWPVRGKWRAAVSQSAETAISLVPRQVVVVTRVMVVGIDAAADGIQQRQMVRLLTQHRQMLRQPEPGRRSLPGSKRPTILLGSVGLHVPHIQVRRPAAQEEQNGTLGFSRP